MRVGRVGFTGTGKGINKRQEKVLRKLLKKLNPIELHHGDCVGADATASDIADGLGIKVIIHPPVNNKARAYKKGFMIRTPKSYLKRNHDIVDECNLLIACPHGNYEEMRSGTWATIRYAQKIGKSIRIIYPTPGMR